MMVTLTTVNWIVEADILCAQLESAGIKTFVPDQNTASVQPIYANAIGGIRVQIAQPGRPMPIDTGTISVSLSSPRWNWEGERPREPVSGRRSGFGF